MPIKSDKQFRLMKVVESSKINVGPSSKVAREILNKTDKNKFVLNNKRKK